MRSCLFLIVVSMLLAACSLPRGAAINSEVLAAKNSKTPSFQVVPVTRVTAPGLRDWPATGWSGHYEWFGRDKGPDSSVIQTGDLLSIVIWDNQDNSLLSSTSTKLTELPSMEVSSSGSVYMPYVGEIAVRGLTQPEARARLQDALFEISPSAQVQLSVVAGRNNSVDLVSGFEEPGRYPLENRNTNILTAFALGGGISPDLRNPLVRLQRGGKTYETRAETLLAEAARNVRLRGGDQITVVEDERSFNVLGAAQKESVIYFEKEEMSVMEALSAMGGILDSRANPRGVLVLRDYDPEDITPGNAGPDMRQVVFTLNLTSADGLFAARQFRIHPGDTLLATESPITSAQTILGLLGTVVGFSATVNNLTD